MGKVHLASSLIVVARNTPHQIPKILAVRRSPQMNNFPTAMVFPGGYVDDADKHVDWLSIVPLTERNVNFNVLVSNQERNSPEDSKAVSSRIAAIRETFEECGILLCQKTDDTNLITLSSSETKIWRKKVHKDAFEFLNLCRTHHCFPNIRALYLFSNWISPYSAAKRFDTTFFFTTVDHEVEIIADDTETDHVEWRSANGILEDDDIFLAPPQIYELTKLANFKNIDLLERCVCDVDSRGCQQFIPVHVKTTDGEVLLLPGDDRYNELLNANVKNPIKLNCETLNFRRNVMHRIECQKLPGSKIVRNVLIQNVDPQCYQFLLKTDTYLSHL